jgi:hypothetical protein
VYRLSSLLPHGSARRDDITRATSSSSVGRWLARGDLVLLHPGVVGLPDRAADWLVRAEAACLWAGGPLSHLSALTATGLVGPSAGALHVTVPVDRLPRGSGAVIAHLSARRLVTVRSGRLEATEPARSLVDAWGWPHVPRRNSTVVHESAVVRQAVIGASGPELFVPRRCGPSPTAAPCIRADDRWSNRSTWWLPVARAGARSPS